MGVLQGLFSIWARLYGAIVSLLKCINNDVILMIRSAELGQRKNTPHNAEYSASGSVADKGEKDINYN